MAERVQGQRIGSAEGVPGRGRRGKLLVGHHRTRGEPGAQPIVGLRRQVVVRENGGDAGRERPRGIQPVQQVQHLQHVKLIVEIVLEPEHDLVARGGVDHRLVPRPQTAFDVGDITPVDGQELGAAPAQLHRRQPGRHGTFVQHVVPRHDLPGHAQIVEAREEYRSVGHVEHGASCDMSSLVRPAVLGFGVAALLTTGLVWISLSLEPEPRPRWTITKRVSAHRALVVEVDTVHLEEAQAIARRIADPVQPRFTEILVLFHRPGRQELRRRVQWTREHGYVETVYP